MVSRAFLDRVLREDFVLFVRRVFQTVSPGDEFLANWHHDAIAWALEEIELGLNRRLIVNVPPRGLKSIIISIAWPAWLLGHNPKMRIVCVSYTGPIALKFARECRRVMESAWYRRVFPGTRLSGRRAEHDYETTAGGGRFSTSIDGTLTGRGGDLIIIDDPMSATDTYSEAARKRVIEWFNGTARSRLNNKRKGSVVVIMQRLHEEDLSGHLLEEEGDLWRHLCLPAKTEEDRYIDVGPGEQYFWAAGSLLHPEHDSEEVLQDQRRSMGSMAYSAQYLQDPVPAEGALVLRKWLKFYDTPPTRQPGDLIVQCWDTATKDGVLNDFSACITALVRGNKIYVLDVFCERLIFPDLRAAVIRLAQEAGATTLLIEDAASGAQLLQELGRECPRGVPSPTPLKPEGDKTTRFAGQTSRIEAGDLLLPREAPWLGEFMHQLIGFPNVKKDDQADALAHLLNWSRRRPQPVINEGPILISDDDDDTDWSGPIVDDGWGA